MKLEDFYPLSLVLAEAAAGHAAVMGHAAPSRASFDDDTVQCSCRSGPAASFESLSTQSVMHCWRADVAAALDEIGLCLNASSALQPCSSQAGAARQSWSTSSYVTSCCPGQSGVSSAGLTCFLETQCRAGSSTGLLANLMSTPFNASQRLSLLLALQRCRQSEKLLEVAAAEAQAPAALQSLKHQDA